MTLTTTVDTSRADPNAVLGSSAAAAAELRAASHGQCGRSHQGRLASWTPAGPKAGVAPAGAGAGVRRQQLRFRVQRRRRRHGLGARAGRQVMLKAFISKLP